jgi:hypothetical protein
LWLGQGGQRSYGCELMRLAQDTESAAFRFNFLPSPVTVCGFVIWNDRGTTGDGIADLAVELYDSSDNLVAAFETLLEDLTTEHAIYFGDPSLPSGDPGALQSFDNVAYAIWRLRSFHGDPGPDPDAHQLREVGFNPVAGEGYEVIAAEFTPAAVIPDDTAINEICNHPCPSKLRFRRNFDDYVHLRAGVSLPAAFDPETSAFEITLFSGGNLVFEGNLEVGDMTRTGLKWNFRDRSVRNNPAGGIRDGIAFMSMSPNNAGIWRWRMKAFADFSAATDAEISVVLNVDGSNVFARTSTWKDRRNGFGFDLTNP